MATSAADSWGQLRQTFADQFESDGATFIYRRSQKGKAIRVSPAERIKFIEEFDRNVRLANWLIYGGVALVLGGVIGFSLLRGTELSQGAILIGVSLAIVPYFAFYRWTWEAPVRELGGRIPIAGERPSDEVRRMRFRRVTYGQLASAAFGGVLIPFMGSSRQDVFSGWNRLWLLFGGVLVLFAAVQAFRKWRFEHEDSCSNLIPRPPSMDVTELVQEPTVSVTSKVWRYAALAVIVLGVPFIAYTSAGKQLATQPNFWPIIMIACGCWSLLTVVQGFSNGQIEPFARGFYNTYQRNTQTKRFWLSMAWNALFGLTLFGLAFGSYWDGRTTLEERQCYDREDLNSASDVLTACGTLIAKSPDDPQPYFNRGLMFLDTMKFGPAITDFTRAHELDPGWVWPLADRGMSFAWKNDRVRAEADFRAAMAINPKITTPARGETVLDLLNDRHEQAIARLDELLKRDPEDRWALMMRADAYQQMGKFDQARGDREKIIKLRR